MIILLLFSCTFTLASHITVVSEENQLATVHLFLPDQQSKFSFEAQGEVCSLYFNHEPLITYEAQELSTHAELNIAGTLDVASLFYDDQPQPTLIFLDDFDGPFEGWSDERVSKCGTSKNQFLGGPCQFSDIMITKTFEGLPAHEMLSLSFNFNFIDEWEGEYAQLKINNEIVWQEAYNWCEKVLPWMCTKFGLNVCGNETPDQFGQLGKITIPHSEESVTLEFSTTLGEKDNCRASWGIDNVEIYVL